LKDVIGLLVKHSWYYEDLLSSIRRWIANLLSGDCVLLVSFVKVRTFLPRAVICGARLL
jgi:hypothetical protein